MTLKYQSGRVSRLAVGVPGFTTSGDLTLDVSGSLGIGTTQPRSEADVPNISIRGDIRDSANETGANAYYLSQDAVGVRWRAGNPDSLQVINVQDDGVQVGFGSFDTLNFQGIDPFVVNIKEGNPNTMVADIFINPGFVKSQYGPTNNSFSLSTSFGSDGTFWTIPGYQPGFGVSESPGFISVGLGTNKPTDDFQVGVGSTGVTINAALGRVRAKIIEADSIEVDGNLTVESLFVTPGIATLTTLEVLTTASIPIGTIGTAFVGFGTFDDFYADQVRTGVTTLGFNGEDTDINGELTVVGFATFRDDVSVAGDLEVGGEFTVGQLNAINALISGIATINSIDGNVGLFTGLNVGLATVGQIGFNTGIGTDLNLETLTSGFGTVTNLTSGIASIGFITATDAFVGGAVTVGNIDVDVIDVEFGNVGVLTVGTGLSVTGVSTFVGLVTITGEAFIDGDLTVTEQFTVKDLGAENLEVTGIATIRELESDVGIITSLNTENLENSGIITSNAVEAQSLSAGVGTIASIFATEIDADEGRIGILTGDLVSYGIGTFTNAFISTASVGVITGDQLFYYGNSQINGATFLDDLFRVNRNVEIVSGVTTINTGEPGVGFATFSDDVYVGNDLFVAGELNFEQLTGENLLVTGIATINQLKINTGVGTFLDLEYLRVGVGTIRDLFGETADVDVITNETLFVENAADIRVVNSRFINIFPDALNPGSGLLNSTFAQIGVATIQLLDAVVAGIQTADVGEGNIGVASIGVATVGLASVTRLEFSEAEGGELNVGIITAVDGTFDTISIGNTSSGSGTIITDDGIITDNGVFRGVLTATSGIVTNLDVEFSNTGIATVGFASITDSLQGVSTIGFADIADLNAGVGTVGILTVTDFLFSTGVSTFVGVTSIFGSAIVDGDLTVTGITTFNQLDADQSQIGILTVKTILDANGIINAEDVVIEKDLRVLGFSSFTGFATFTDALFDDITTGILSVTEQAYFENIYQSPTGIATLNVVGITSALIDQTTIGVATVGFGSFKGLFAENANISGVITAKGEITVEGEVSITGIATIDQLNVTGIATIAREEVGVSSIGIATIQEADIEDLDVETFRVGTYATIGRTGAANTEVGIMSVTGISTFVGLVTTKGDLFVDGSLFVTGIQSIPQLDADQARIGILTVSDFINVNGNFIQTATGFSTLSNFSFPTGVGSTLSVGFATFGDVSVSGVVSIAQDLLVERNLQVLGISSLGSLSTVTGFTTVLSDLYVGGNIYVKQDIFKDELFGRQLFVTGVGTIITLNATTGVVTTIRGTDLTYDNGNFDIIETVDITSDNVYAGLTSTTFLTSKFSSIGIATATSLEAVNVTVSGLTSTSNLVVGVDARITDLTVTNDVVIENDLSVENEVSILNDVEIGLVGSGTSLTVNDNIYTDKLELRHLEAETINVGIQTFTERLDVNDTTSIYSVRADTNSTFGTIVETIDANVYNAFEMTITSVEGTKVQSTKVHGVADGSDVFSNEYSTVFNVEEIVTVELTAPGGNLYSVLITNMNPTTVTNTLNITLTRVP